MKLVVQQSGIGPKLTLVHGWAMHGGLFQGLVNELPDQRVQRVDLPGHGRNRELDWPNDTDQVVTALADCAAGGWLAGWSLGGLLAMQAALTRPKDVKGLILMAATPCFGRRAHWPHGVADALVEQLADELAAGPEPVLNRFLALEVHGSENAAADLRLLRRQAFAHGVPGTDALRAGLDHLRQTDLTDRLTELQVPVLLIGGRRDRLVPFSALEACASVIPGAELVRIAGAAHAPFLTDAGAVAAAIRQFTHRNSE